MDTEHNVGTYDRLGRLAVALLLLFFLVKSGRVGLRTAVALVVSGALLSTAASGNCALYTHLGISTSEKI